MKDKIIIVLLIMLIGVGIWGYIGWNRTLPEKTVIKLKENELVKTIVKNRKVTVVSEKQQKIVPVVRGREVEVTVNKDGEVVVDKVDLYMPHLVLLPQCGLSVSAKIEPLLGFQVLRSEVLGGIGLSANITPTTASISIDKDLYGSLSNTNVGICYGIDKEGYTRTTLKIGVYLGP